VGTIEGRNLQKLASQPWEKIARKELTRRMKTAALVRREEVSFDIETHALDARGTYTWRAATSAAVEDGLLDISRRALSSNSIHWAGARRGVMANARLTKQQLNEIVDDALKREESCVIAAEAAEAATQACLQLVNAQLYRADRARAALQSITQMAVNALYLVTKTHVDNCSCSMCASIPYIKEQLIDFEKTYASE
jgi:hypothetical protein